MILAWILGCAPALDPEGAALAPLPTLRLARRASLDLRGVLPSDAELDALEADPAGLDALIDTWLDDPRLEERVVHLLQERWHTRVDTFDIPAYDYGIDATQAYTYARAVGEEPLRLAARVVRDDRPWSDVVTADWTMAHDVLATAWPLDFPAGATGWQVARYTDGRPAAGVLSTNGLWWRYTTNTSNMNRGRAAAISRVLLCEDLLARPVSFTFAGGTTSDPAAAVREDPACLACHASLDPVAATLFGFWWLNMYSAVEETRYHPERERLSAVLGVSPAWAGAPVDGLAELGWAVAEDSRLYRCAVDTFAAGLWRRDPTVDDFDTIEALRDDFVRGGAIVRPLLRAIVATPEYRAGAVASGSGMDRVHTERMLTPAQLASAIGELTGFRWTWDGADLLDEDTMGFRALAGGVDGDGVAVPQREPGLTWALVVARVAQGAGAHAAGSLGEGTGLLGAVDPAAQPDDPVFGDTVAALHRRFYGEPADPAWVADIGALWEAVDTTDGPEAAWAATVGAMLRDPRFVTE